MSAFDSTGYQPKEQNRLTVNVAGSDNSTSSGSMTHGEVIEHKGRLYGNIGVTTSQQMLQSELDLRKLNMLDYIVKGFAHEYLIVAGGEDGD